MPYRAIEFLTSKAELDTAVPVAIKLLRQIVPWNFAAEEYVNVSPVKLDYAVNATIMFWRSTALPSWKDDCSLSCDELSSLGISGIFTRLGV